MLFRFFPQEFKFFDLLEEQADFAVAAAVFFKEVVAKGEVTVDALSKMRDIEHQGDEAAHAIIDRLNRTFVTPFDREDHDLLDCGFDPQAATHPSGVMNPTIFTPSTSGSRISLITGSATTHRLPRGTPVACRRSIREQEYQTRSSVPQTGSLPMLRVYQRKNPLTSLLPRRFTPSATVERIERRARSKRISPSCCTMGMAPAMRETPAGPGQRQPPDERDSGPKGADSQVHEKWSGFAEHGRLVEVFNKDAAARVARAIDKPKSRRVRSSCSTPPTNTPSSFRASEMVRYMAMR